MKIGLVSSFRLFAFLFLSFLSSASFAEETIWIPYKAVYVASLNDSVVDDNGERELKYLGNQTFRFTAIAENLLFKIEEVSEFEVINGDTVRSLQYQSTRSNPFKKRKKAVGFDWPSNTMHFEDRKKSGSRAIPKDIYDPLSSVFELAKQVKAGKQSIAFKEASGRKIKERSLNVAGKETIAVPYGSLETIKLTKIEDKRETTIWLAPSLNHLAVRVKQVNDKGETYELALKSYKPKTPITLQKPTSKAETPQLVSEPDPSVIAENIK